MVVAAAVVVLIMATLTDSDRKEKVHGNRKSCSPIGEGWTLELQFNLLPWPMRAHPSCPSVFLIN